MSAEPVQGDAAPRSDSCSGAAAGAGGPGGFASPHDAAAALCAHLAPVGVEQVSLDAARGRILAQALAADRDSPAHDVSAVDGYAVRLVELAEGRIPLAGDVPMGTAPIPLPPGAALRVYTGSAVPPGAEAILMREDVEERGDVILLRDARRRLTAGENIRPRGENGRAGETVVEAGSVITPAVVAGLATFGAARPQVRRRVRVAILNTGNELLGVDDRPAPWQIRDSNGPALLALLAAHAWIAADSRRRIDDDLEQIRAALADALEHADAVLLTGGVSAGQFDFVPAAAQSLGARVVFHRLPLRPGRPAFGAVGPRGQAILGLPGNPLSVMATAGVLALPALRVLGGLARPFPLRPHVRVANDDARTLHLWWYRMARVVQDGVVELVPNRGSGDVVSLARSDGFVEIPPHAGGPGPWPFHAWPE